ncbi:MAG: hypothetical protein C0475_02295 [Planctomyces sp.]|nr:hypothetical protein [Planctomyces sp.]MBA4038907.1 hypothetical protein [Planctomyces sp.]
MITHTTHPSGTPNTPQQTPQQAADPAVARGVLADAVEATATTPAYIVFALPGTSYALHLRTPTPTADLRPALGKRAVGTIRCRARRADVVSTGGRYVEPVIGRPRRVQGTILEIRPTQNAIVVSAGGAASVDGQPLPIVCELTAPNQRAESLAVGQLVSMDVHEGATFTFVR